MQHQGKTKKNRRNPTHLIAKLTKQIINRKGEGRINKLTNKNIHKIVLNTQNTTQLVRLLVHIKRKQKLCKCPSKSTRNNIKQQ